MSNTQWQRIADHFRDGIETGRLRAGDRLPSDARLAEEWGVSRPTAHRALHELQRLGFVLRSKLGTVVAEPMANVTGRVALIFDHMAAAYDFPQADLVRGIQEGLGDHHNLLFCDSKDDADREAEFLSRMQHEADGVILFPTGNPQNLPLIQCLAQRRAPLVLLDRLPECGGVDAVLSNNAEATRIAVQALVDRGHRKIGFFGFHKPHVSTVLERFDAYREVLAESGIPLNDRYVRWFSPEIEHQQDRRFIQAVGDALFTLTKGPDAITALFSVQDMFACAALDLADEFGIRVPEDLEIATFNDWPPSMLRRPWQTHRIVPRRAEIGRAAAERLHALMRRKGGESFVTRISAEFVFADAGLTNFTRQTNGG